jgi:hypothetical protein
MKTLIVVGGKEDVTVPTLLGCQLRFDEEANAVRRPEALKAPGPRLLQLISGGLALEGGSSACGGKGHTERHTSENRDLNTQEMLIILRRQLSRVLFLTAWRSSL